MGLFLCTHSVERTRNVGVRNFSKIAWTWLCNMQRMRVRGKRILKHFVEKVNRKSIVSFIKASLLWRDVYTKLLFWESYCISLPLPINTIFFYMVNVTKEFEIILTFVEQEHFWRHWKHSRTEKLSNKIGRYILSAIFQWPEFKNVRKKKISKTINALTLLISELLLLLFFYYWLLDMVVYNE